MEYVYLLVGIITLFWRSMKCGYVVDDGVMYQFWKDRKQVPLSHFSIRNRIWHALYGAGVFRNRIQEHMFTTAMHYAICCLIYKATGSLVVSFLYMCNPVNNQTTIWLNGRRYQIGILCALLIWNYKILFIPIYAFAVWLHIGIVALPLMMLFTPSALFASLGIPICLLFGWKRFKNRFNARKNDFSTDNELHKLTPKKLIIYIKCLGFYFFHTIIPNKPRMYHEFMYYFSRYDSENKKGYSFNFDFFKGLAVTCFIGYEILIAHNLWAVWWLVFISQWCGIITVTQLVSDRYCSLAGVGLMAILVKYMNMIPTPYNLIVYACLFTFYILRYLPLFWAYKNVDNFHNYHISIQPDGVESRSLQAVRYMRMNDAFSAFAVLKKGLRYRPNDFKLLITMSQTLFALNNPTKALQVLEIAGKHIPIGDEKDFKEEREKIHNNPKLGGKILNRKQRRNVNKLDKKKP